MIVLCGIPSETPIAMVARELWKLGEPYVFFDQRRFDDNEMVLELERGTLTGYLHLEGRRYPLERVAAAYVRLMDHRALPELEGVAEDEPRHRACAQLHERLLLWCDAAECRVVNRPASMASNNSKPYQAQLIRDAGLGVPTTLITNDPDAVRDFRAVHGRIIYKSISGVRSIVREVEDDDLHRLDHVRSCPTQFQAYVPGEDVRVHVVGNEVFATAVRHSAADYRYAAREGAEPPVLSAVELPAELSRRCVELREALGMAFVGIDLRLAADAAAVCFEVNPCPAFSYYEGHTKQPIARAVARWISRRD